MDVKYPLLRMDNPLTLWDTYKIVGICRRYFQIVPFHKDFSPRGEQLELRKLAHEL